MSQPTDTERMNWLAENLFGADFDYGDPDNPIHVLTIRIPEGARVGSDLRDNVDRFLAASSVSRSGDKK
jgi:hypothetical protein